MQHFRRLSIGVVAGAVSLSLVGAAGASAPKHAVGLTKGKTPFSQNLNIVAGSASAVVFETGPSWQRGPSGNVRLEVKSSKGKVRQLALAKGQSVQNYSSWSLAKNLLVAENSTNQKVTWWSLTGKAHGQKPLPSGYQLLGASPNGWILQNQSTDVIYNQVAAGHGKPTKIGTPFAKASFKGVEAPATSGSTGVALHGQSGGFAYLKWGTKKFKNLKVNPAKQSISSCNSLAGGAVGCSGSLSGKTGSYIFRIPLNGKPVVVTKVLAKWPFPSNVSVTASATAWNARSSTGVDTKFFSTTAKGKGVKTSKHVTLPGGYTFHSPGTATSAFGKIAVVTGSTRSLKLATVANAGGKPKTTVSAALGVVHAASVSLSSNRVAYTDNQKAYNAGDVWSRNLSGKSVGGAAELISTSATSDGLSISGTTTADSESPTGNGSKAKAHIAIRVGSHIGSVVGTAAQASGSNVLYTNAKNKLAIYNGKTRKSSLAKLPAGYARAFLDGTSLVFIEADGSVWQEGLTASAVPRMLVAAQAGFEGALSLSASGADVAWSEDVNNAITVQFCVVTASGSCAVKSAGGSSAALDAATTNGVLLVTSKFSSSSSKFTWTLKPYSGGKARTVLSQTYSSAQLGSSPVGTNDPLNPQVSVAGGRIAWIDPGGAAHIAKLP